MTQSLIDLDRYPIDRLQSDPGQALLRDCQRRFEERGVCLLHDFIKPDAVERMVAEADGLLPKAFYCHNTHNAYLKGTDNAFDEHHPRNRRLRTDVGSIANDFLHPDGDLCRLYAWEPLTRFIGAVLGYDEFYTGADPLGALSVNVFAPGGGHAWHFDEARFTVTIMLQPADEGGHFDYVPQIRSNDDDNYAEVGRILDGDEGNVERLAFYPGTLSIFGGRYTLHRVTKVGGIRHRLVPVLVYDTKPGSLNTEQVRMLFWGRTGNEHVANV